MKRTSIFGFALLLAFVATVPALAVEVTVSIENLAPRNGNFLTPVWVGFHDGSFDSYDVGVAATPGLERIAEDGNTAPISGEFLGSGAGTVDGTIPGPGGPIAPGDTATMTFDLDPNELSSRYFSYVSMIIPSNDAFIANGNPVAHAVFDAHGNFVGGSFIVGGPAARDAGTEVNDEIPENTAFFGQMAPDTGVVEGGTVQVHPGFLPAGSGGILDDPMFAGADFTQDGYQFARITLSTTTNVRVTVENLAPENGNFLTPAWVGFHNGTFDIYDLGAPASPGLERIAEDGNTMPISGEFLGSGAGTVDATIPGPNGPIAPGDVATRTFALDPSDPSNRFFSYASMIIPSNDAFVANASPTAHAVFDELGNFVGGSFILVGSRVRDAGTEVNDEVPENTAFFGQMAPDTGVVEGGFVHVHEGFLPVGSGGILDDPMFAAADFTQAGYQVARITLSVDKPGRDVVKLNDERFHVTARWRTNLGEEGEGLGNALTNDTGYFYFFSQDNIELVVKVLNGCDINNRFWVFAGGLTDVEVEITVTDTVSGETETYNNELDTPFQPVRDTDAFDTCP